MLPPSELLNSGTITREKGALSESLEGGFTGARNSSDRNASLSMLEYICSSQTKGRTQKRPALFDFYRFENLTAHPRSLRFFGLAVIGLARFIVGMRRAFVRRIGVLRRATVSVRVAMRSTLARCIGLLDGHVVNVRIAARLALRSF